MKLLPVQDESVIVLYGECNTTYKFCLPLAKPSRRQTTDDVTDHMKTAYSIHSMALRSASFANMQPNEFVYLYSQSNTEFTRRVSSLLPSCAAAAVRP
eukprot:scaffold121586_cov20-Prasinocladus_malaysianus.AAC.2